MQFSLLEITNLIEKKTGKNVDKVHPVVMEGRQLDALRNDVPNNHITENVTDTVYFGTVAASGNPQATFAFRKPDGDDEYYFCPNATNGGIFSRVVPNVMFTYIMCGEPIEGSAEIAFSGYKLELQPTT